MSTEEPKPWQIYEGVARFLLEKLADRLGLKIECVEGKQKLVGESRTEWEIDGKGVRADDGAVIVIECRRLTTSRVKQNAVAALAYSISDLNASGGIIVTPIGVQKGGRLIAEREGIKTVRLDANSTTDTYLLEFLGSIFVGPRGASLTLTGAIPEIIIAPAEPDE
jgi:hypothetical protein